MGSIEGTIRVFIHFFAPISIFRADCDRSAESLCCRLVPGRCKGTGDHSELNLNRGRNSQDFVASKLSEQIICSFHPVRMDVAFVSVQSITILEIPRKLSVWASFHT